MKSIRVFVVVCGLLPNVGLAQENRTNALQPSILEAFAAQPTASVTWSSEVGRIDSTEAQAVVTALVVEDPAQVPQRMRGVRIDLSNQSATDQVYVEEVRLQAVSEALEEIERGRALASSALETAPLSYFGSAEFRQPYPTVHALNAAYYTAPDSSGLSLSAYLGQDFRFPDRSPSELAVAIDRAIQELEELDQR